MAYTGINLGNVKVSNRSAILRLLSDRGSLSRKDIALSLGLTPASVTQICSELIAAGILIEGSEPAKERRAGRRKVPISINYQYRYVLTFCIEAQETCIALSDLSGRVLAEKTLPTDDTLAPDAFLKLVSDEAKILLWESQMPRSKILGAGVSVPGTVVRSSGTSERAYRIWNERVELRQLLGGYLDLPVIVENNVKAFAAAELVYGIGRAWENLLFIKWGPGVGSAAVIHNQIYDGLGYRGVEIGHCIVRKDGRPCRCGRHGCLETEVSTHALVRRIKAVFSKDATPELWELTGGDAQKVSARNIERCLAAQDAAVWEIVDAAIEELARATANATTLFAPQKVVLYGYLFGLSQVRGRFLAACERYDPAYNADYLLSSGLGDKKHYIGPLAVAVNEFFLMGGGSDEA